MSNKMTSYESSLKHKVDKAAVRALLKLCELNDILRQAREAGLCFDDDYLLKIITDGFAKGLESLQRTNKKGGVA